MMMVFIIIIAVNRYFLGLGNNPEIVITFGNRHNWLLNLFNISA